MAAESRQPAGSGLYWQDIVYDIPLPKKQRKQSIAENGSSNSPNTSLEKGGELQDPSRTQGLRPIKAGDRRILNGVSGKVERGEMVGLLGASGAGKTTLLNILSARLDSTGELSGQVLFQGSQRDPESWKRTVGFVEQDDVLIPCFTVHETLDYSARLRLDSSISNEEKRQRVEDTLDMLRLEKCRDTRIGNGATRGVSGGERKRTSIGVELVSDVSLLLLDEPTSGLDSFAATNVVSNLKLVATKRNLACLMTIHQPSWNIFCMYDRVMLLTRGSIFYEGPPKKALEWFESLGHRVPEGVNPADYFITIAENLEKSDEGERRIDNLLRAWRENDKSFLHQDNEVSTPSEKIQTSSSSSSSSSASQVDRVLPGDEEEKLATLRDRSKGFAEKKEVESLNGGERQVWKSQDHKGWPTSWLAELRILTERNAKQTMRDLTTLIGSIGQSVILLIIIGFAFFRLGSSQSDVLARIGVLFFLPINASFAVLFPILTQFPLQRQVMIRERSSGLYRTSSFYLSKVIVEIPNTILQRSFFYIIIYWMIGLKGTASSFFIFMGLNYLQLLTSIGLALAIGAASPTIELANIIAPLFNVIFLLFGGNLLPSPPPWFIWLHWISPITYVYSALSVNEFVGSTFDCNGSGSGSGSSASQCYSTGEQVLEQYKLQRFTIGENCGFLVAIAFVFTLTGYFLLRYTGHPRFRYI
ncbi:hypothetical protein IE53DRAFT_260034 [Violaceomyces palustris]|uniref:Uncharacterized protein n=1 Tax=Violaceomyces palustris TaxID=1673888 RepID=A0ACD0NN63_9BASI|nr:hypothetical protein IE53DRAFT_260034 [Violaceomyces palustris]